MKKFVLLSSTLLSIFSQHTLAAWEHDERVRYENIRHPFQDGIVSTIWGFFNFNVEDRQYVPNFKTIYVKNPMGTGQVPVFVNDVRFLRDQIKRPLLVFFPGIFAQHNDERLKKLVHYANARGFHCMSIASPWSPSFIGSKTGTPPGNVFQEGKNLREITQKVILEYFGEDQLSSVALMGESYGAFMASVAAAIDSKSDKPIFSSKVTLLHPPLDIIHGMNVLDDLMEENKEKYLNSKSSDYVFYSLSYLAAKNDLSLPPRAREHAGHLLAYSGFNRGLFNAIKSYERHYNINLMPSFNQTEDEKRYKSELRFKKYLQDYYPNLFNEIDPKMMSLIYWINQFSPDLKSNLRILTSQDDFLNEGIQTNWSELSNNTIVMKRGGHSSVFSLNEFYDAIQITLSSLEQTDPNSLPQLIFAPNTNNESLTFLPDSRQ